MDSLSLSISTGEAAATVRWAQAAEAAGFEALWTAEMVHDPFLPLAAVAGHTRRIQLGTSIALAFVRSPWVTALAALDMDLLSGGRFILGLGTGLKRLNERWHGVAYGKPTPHIRECVQVIRLIMEKAHRSEPIRFSGQYYDVDIQGWQRPFLPVRPRVPIYLGGIRPGMIRTAGQVADGLLGHPICSLPWIRKVVLPTLEQALLDEGRQRRDFRVCLSVCCAIAADRRQAQRAAAATIAFYATANTYEPVFQAHGFQRQVQQIREALLRDDTTAMVEAVSEEMIEAFTLAGTPDEVRGKLAPYATLADSMCLVPPDQLIEPQEADVFRQAILETFSR